MIFALGDLVRVERLGELEGSFVSRDERGEIAFIALPVESQIMEVAEFSQPGVCRGNHYHAFFTERTYVFRGSVELVVSRVGGRDKTVIMLSQGDLVTIQPNVVHVIRSLTEAVLFTGGSGSNPFDDRIRCVLDVD